MLYTLNLAHWPVLVVYPFATGRKADASLADRALHLTLSSPLAHPCKRCWEDCFRRGRREKGAAMDTIESAHACLHRIGHELVETLCGPVPFDSLPIRTIRSIKQPQKRVQTHLRFSSAQRPRFIHGRAQSAVGRSSLYCDGQKIRHTAVRTQREGVVRRHACKRDACVWALCLQ